MATIETRDGHRRDTRDMSDEDLLKHYLEEERDRIAEELEHARNRKLREEARNRAEEEERRAAWSRKSEWSRELQKQQRRNNRPEPWTEPGPAAETEEAAEAERQTGIGGAAGD